MEPTTTVLHINELQLHTSVWVSLKTIMMHEKIKSQKNTYQMILLMGASKKHAKLDNILCQIMCVYVN